MKKVFILTVLLSLIFIGCNDSVSGESSYENNAKNNLINANRIDNNIIRAVDFDYVGAEHNRILSNFYDKLSMNDVEEHNALTFANNLIKNEIADKGVKGDDLILSNKLIDEEIAKVRKEGDPLYIGYEKDLTEDAKLFLDKLNNILLIQDVNEEQRINEIEKLNSEVEISKLSDEEKKVIFVGSAVTKYSVKFWSKNLEIIAEKFGKNNVAGKKGIWGYVKGCWAADAAGAVTGGVRTFVANAIPGGGQATYAGAVIGGGVAGSAAYHIINLLN
ncbi:hypothetical protein [uncultured Chryseobacterium sp.]|uniref:hypothetical protein n=1 Tax=uncultured Chryseobacterium sp. TaxID=259322 RepID=UPI0025DA103F|nr:hypothetical protein [uncultured Chryseobacterium sp.]